VSDIVRHSTDWTSHGLRGLQSGGRSVR
jgi:hypothetical protein